MDGCRVKARPKNDSSAPCAFSTPPADRFVQSREANYLVELQGKTVGMVTLLRRGRDAGCVGRFYLDPAWQRTAVFDRLVSCMHKHCLGCGYSRLSIDTSMVPGWVRRCLAQRGFRLLRREQVDGREMLEFSVEAADGLLQPC